MKFTKRFLSRQRILKSTINESNFWIGSTDQHINFIFFVGNMINRNNVVMLIANTLYSQFNFDDAKTCLINYNMLNVGRRGSSSLIMFNAFQVDLYNYINS